MNYTNRFMRQRIEIKKNIWVEKLTIFAFFYFMLYGILSKISIYYDENQIARFAKFFLSTLVKYKCVNNFFPAALLLNVKDKQGCAIEYARLNDLDTCIGNFCQEVFPDKPDRFKDMLKSYIALELKGSSTFISMILAKINFSDNDTRAKNKIYFKYHPLNYLLVKFYNERFSSIALRQFFNFKIFLKFYFKFLYFITIYFLFGKLSSVKPKSSLQEIRNAVWTEYYPKTFFDHLFWCNTFSSDKFDIVCYLDRSDTLVDSKTTSAIEGRGLKWIDLDFYQLVRLARFKLSDFIILLKTLKLFLSFRPKWFTVFMFEYQFRLLLYASVFRKFSVKILLQHQDYSWIQEVQAEAIENSGGIMIGYHWSNLPFYQIPTHIIPHHVYFVWGKIMHDCVRKQNSTCYYILPSGVNFLPENIELEKIKELSARAGFILCIFDSDAAYNFYQSPETLSLFYLKILGLLQQNINFAAIIKSKDWNSVNDLIQMPRRKEIVHLMDLLISQKRMAILDSNINPITASSNADLSVCFGLNSAGIVSSLYGHRVIHWDCSGWLKYSLYKDNNQQIVYYSLDEFMEAILKASKGDKRVGDFSNWRKIFNYFNDFQAAIRVGHFIKDYMEESINSHNPDYLLSNVVKRYIMENNIGQDFFKIGKFWEDDRTTEFSYQ